MTQIFKYILMAFGLGMLLGCQNEDDLTSWFQNPDRLNNSDAEVLNHWLLVNNLDPGIFVAREASHNHSGTFSVLIEAGAVHAIKAKGVNSLAHLSELTQLASLDLGQVKFTSLSGCPASLQKLRLSGKALRSLAGIESCAKLESVKMVHTDISDLKPLFKLPMLRQLTFNFSPLAELDIHNSAPHLATLNLQKNQLKRFSIHADIPQLEQLFLDHNQLKTVALKDHTPKLQIMGLANNQIDDLQKVSRIDPLTSITLSDNPISDLKPLADWPNLQNIKFKGHTDTPIQLQGKVDPMWTATDLQRQEAINLKEKYLADGHFIEELPKFSGGNVIELSKQTSSLFSLNGPSTVSGWIKAGKISGMVKIPVAQSDNLSYHFKTITIEGTATVAQGELRIYSPVDVNFWQMAAVFVDQPIKKAPEEVSDLILEGYREQVIKAGETKRFKAQLLPFSDRYLLLVAATDPSGEAVGVELQFE